MKEVGLHHHYDSSTYSVTQDSMMSYSLHHLASSPHLLSQWSTHVDFVKAERGEYWARRSEGAQEGADVLSMIIDGQDQSATALPAYSEVTGN